jgi:phosphatidylserine/phosphatidylglycerophosphate/cardiolipin synthase-like enzyme
MPEPEQLDFGDIRCREGFFIPRDAEQRPFVAEQAHTTSDWAFCSTFRGSPQTLQNAVLNLIRGARQKVYVTSFILGDDTLTEILAHTASRLTGGVYVISELSERSLRLGLQRLADDADRGKSIGPKVEAEKKRFLSLTNRGVALRGHENCHAKFIVVDDSIAWLGSANLETKAFTDVGEVGVVTTDKAEVRRLARLFGKMWLTGCRWELPNTDDYAVLERQSTPTSFSALSAVGGASPAIIWTSQTEHALQTSIHDVISKARTNLLLASFSLDGMIKRPDLLIEPLASAIGRGVAATMLVRAHNGRDRHRADANQLCQLGVRLVADDLNHAKAVIADNEHAAVFSANFDAHHGLDAGSGIEVGARLDHTSALPELSRYLQHAIDSATYEYQMQPTQRQVNHPSIRHGMQRWPLATTINVEAELALWEQLKADVRAGPVIWTQQTGEPVTLFAGRGRWRLQPRTVDHYHLRRLPTADISAQEQFEQWRQRRSVTEDNYGYCPAVLNRRADN